MYNAEGEEVWRRRLDLNGKILEEVYNRNAPYSDRIPFLFQGQYYDYETGLAYNPLNKGGDFDNLHRDRIEMFRGKDHPSKRPFFKRYA